MIERKYDFTKYKVTEEQRERIVSQTKSWYITSDSKWNGDVLELQLATSAGSAGLSSLSAYFDGLLDGLPKKPEAPVKTKRSLKGENA